MRVAEKQPSAWAETGHHDNSDDGGPFASQSDSWGSPVPPVRDGAPPYRRSPAPPIPPIPGRLCGADKLTPSELWVLRRQSIDVVEKCLQCRGTDRRSVDNRDHTAEVAALTAIQTILDQRNVFAIAQR